MSMTTAVALLLLQASVSPGSEVRSVTVSVTDGKGAPIEGLARDDVAVVENGVARDVTRVEPDTRPLVVAVLVDSSQEISSSYRLHIAAAVTAFLGRLPENTRFTVWTTGDRPTKIVELTDDRGEAAKALKRAFTTGGNTLLDAIVEASRELKTQEGSRTAVVVVTGMSTNLSNRDRYRAVEEASKNADLFLAVQFEEGTADFEARAEYNYVLETLTKKSGGLFETSLSSMGVAPALQKLSGELKGRYRVSYATLPEIKNRKLEIQVARPGAKVRTSATVTEPSNP